MTPSFDGTRPADRHRNGSYTEPKSGARDGYEHRGLPMGVTQSDAYRDRLERAVYVDALRVQMRCDEGAIR